MPDAFQSWLYQIQNLIIRRFHTMSPQDYGIMLAACVALGYFLLRSKP